MLGRFGLSAESSEVPGVAVAARFRLAFRFSIAIDYAQLHEVIRLYTIAKEMFESKQMYIPVMDERMYIPAPAAATAATAPAGPANAPATPAPKTTAVRVADQTAASPLSVLPHV